MSAERPTYSLHAARVGHVCDACGDMIPRCGEYWRVAWPRSARRVARIVCVMCHVLYGLPSDGWTEPADGERCVTARVPRDVHAL